MDPLTLALIGGGIGLLKSELVDRPKEKRQRQAAAATARWSPWTGMAPGRIDEANPFGSALQGAMAGAMLGQMTGAGADPGAGLTAAEQAQTQPFYMQPTYGQTQSVESPYALMRARQPGF